MLTGQGRYIDVHPLSKNDERGGHRTRAGTHARGRRPASSRCSDVAAAAALAGVQFRSTGLWTERTNQGTGQLSVVSQFTPVGAACAVAVGSRHASRHAVAPWLWPRRAVILAEDRARSDRGSTFFTKTFR